MEYDCVEDDAFQGRVRALMHLMLPMRVVGLEKRRYGRDWDGGYVILPSIETTEVVYSLGISDDVSFDAIVADFGAQIYQYDHTVEGPPVDHQNFHFHKIGIAYSDDWQPNMRRLDTLVRSNGHADNDSLFLKMDIEGHEWDTLSTIDENVLSRFDQIVAEFHSFQNIRNLAWLDRAERALQRLNKTHQVIHVHGNNNGSFQIIAGVAVPEVIELTWARRISYNFEATDEIYPTSLDQPCTPAKPDLFLGNFVFN